MEPRKILSRLKVASFIGALLVAACGTEQEPREAPPVASQADSLEYGCGGGASFALETIAEERTPDQAILEAIERLRETMDGAMLPENGWFVVSEEGVEATLLAADRDRYASATFREVGNRWEPQGWGDCQPRLEMDDMSVLRWAFAKGSYPPAPDSTELSLLVVEVQCSSGRDIEGLIDPTVTYTTSRIEVILTATEPTGTTQTCQGPAPTEYQLILDEPVGERDVVDPSVYPVVVPTPGTRIP